MSNASRDQAGPYSGLSYRQGLELLEALLVRLVPEIVDAVRPLRRKRAVLLVERDAVDGVLVLRPLPLRAVAAEGEMLFLPRLLEVLDAIIDNILTLFIS